jgi:SAM-dependent methyltransferase
VPAGATPPCSTTAIAPAAFDLIVCSGVLEIFDSLDEPLAHLVAGLRPGGVALVQSIFNEHPIDVVMRYRRADSDGPWESGWNRHSQVTVERVLASLAARGLRTTHNWEPFRLAIPLAKRDDVMRAWTVETAHDPHQQVNGAGQWFTPTILHLRRLE